MIALIVYLELENAGIWEQGETAQALEQWYVKDSSKGEWEVCKNTVSIVP